ncbi:MAG TPA: ATP-binding cassette domain-containing protein [Gemmatimonadales bacterium]|nr:ATP-binding cassette domain-containing protein [Gemmatimonadales bacterium]
MGATTANSDGGGLAVVCKRLTRTFGSVRAVRDLDLEVRSGIIFGLLGPNGAGKSTTIRILTTLLPPTSGEARVAGLDVVADAAKVRRRIGYVPQLLSADGALTGRENLLLSARLYRIPRDQRAARIQAALSFMELEHAAGQLVRTYSGGMIRRLELAQAMLHQPEVLFLDEPTIGLDPVARHAVWQHLSALRRETSMTILLTTHDMDEAAALCDEIAFMHAGAVSVAGRPDDLTAAIGPEATLDDVFIQVAGGTIDEGGTYRGVGQLRSSIRRRG